jgi:hypothetical protein
MAATETAPTKATAATATVASAPATAATRHFQRYRQGEQHQPCYLPTKSHFKIPLQQTHFGCIAGRTIQLAASTLHDNTRVLARIIAGSDWDYKGDRNQSEDGVSRSAGHLSG